MPTDATSRPRGRVEAARISRRLLLALAAAAVIAAALALLAHWMHVRAIEGRVSSHREAVAYYGEKYRVPADLISAIIRTESSGRVKAVSGKGAKGLMQVTDAAEEEVLRRYRIEKDTKVRKLIWIKQNPEKQVREVNLLDAEYNIHIGTAYLRIMIDRFGGDTYLAVAAYNMGPTALSALRRAHPTLTSEQLVQQHAPTETRNYCRRIFKLVGGRFRQLPVSADDAR
jgi:soluble lytic murein transglycosylase-like protein